MTNRRAWMLTGFLLSLSLCGCAEPVPSNDEYVQYARAIRLGKIDYVKEFTQKYKKSAISDLEFIGNYFNPVEIAALTDHNDIVKYLLEQGADPNAIIPKSNEPIIFSLVSNQKTEAVQLLIQHGADVDSNDENGRNLLRHAAAVGNYDTVKILLSSVKNVNGVDGLLGNAVFGAVSSGSITILNALVEAGININQQSGYGNTPIMMAIGLENTAMAERLIELGADTKPINEKGFTAAKLAEHVGLKVKGLWPK